MTLGFHPEALSEYEEATDHYCKISTKVSASFISEFEKSVADILENPRAWAEIETDIRRFVMHRFPYGIYYFANTDFITILGVYHLSRAPRPHSERR